MSSIEQYRRIAIGRVAPRAVVDLAADDLSRLLAELLDNATSHSPPDSKVTVGAHLTEHGNVLLRIEDVGIGLPADRLRVLNDELSAGPGRDSGSIEHMGLGVVRRLAGKHGIRVRLDQRATRGIAATVLLPAEMVCEAPATPWFAGTATTKVSQPPPAEQAKSPATPETTRNGLPRRVPQSLREFGSFASTVPSPGHDPESDPSVRREQLMADLDDFSEGERAARQGSPRQTSAGDRVAGPHE